MLPVIALLAVGTGCANKHYVNNNGVNNISDARKSEIEKLIKGCKGIGYVDLGGAQGAYCRDLGNAYAEGRGVKQDYFEAEIYYEKACDLNNPLGCYNLGTFYYHGQTGEKSIRKAISYFEKTCKLNNWFGCRDLGIIYADGLGVRQDKSKAKEYFGKMCDMGLQDGCDNYRKLNEQGY
jgi:TPR repeat protein